MRSSQRSAPLDDRRVVLSALWIFALFNYLYADLLNMIVSPAAMTGMVTGMSEAVKVAWVLVMETAIGMIVLSRVLPYAANRWANIVLGLLHTGLVAWTLTGGQPRPYYLVFAVAEMACTLFIVAYAWRWRREPTLAPS